MTRRTNALTPSGRVHCEDCRHARVGQGELCYCQRHYWTARPLSHMCMATRRCEEFESAEED